MRISDWSSDVCSSDLPAPRVRFSAATTLWTTPKSVLSSSSLMTPLRANEVGTVRSTMAPSGMMPPLTWLTSTLEPPDCADAPPTSRLPCRSEEHTSELQVNNAHLVCRLLLDKKKDNNSHT